VVMIVNMGSLGAAAGTAAATCSRSEVAQCLRLAEAHLHKLGYLEADHP
jgi:hypothetical protein